MLLGAACAPEWFYEAVSSDGSASAVGATRYVRIFNAITAAA
jgi:hypothetical protein